MVANPGRIDRVLVFCLRLETVKVVKPAEYYKPDRAYMLCMTNIPEYRDFKAELEGEFSGLGIPVKAVQTEVWDFAKTLKALVGIMRGEEGNAVYVDVDGPGAYPAAAMVASMMGGMTPYFARTLEQHVPYKAYYKGRRPVGRSSKVADPEALPTFALPPPDKELATGLAVMARMQDDRQLMTDKAVIKRLREAGLDLPPPDGKGASVMLYRRKFLAKWIDSGWVARDGRGRHRVTDYGRVIARVFGEP